MRYRIASLMEEKVDRDVLYSFITEQEEWLDDWLDTLGWTKESLRSETKPELVQCPHNPHHYLPKSSMEEHTKKCGYAVALNTSIWSLEEDRLISLETDSSFLYKDSSAVESVKIDMLVVRAVKKLARDLPVMGQIPRSRGHHMVDEHFSSLESSHSPQGIRNQPYTQLISYIKSWKTVPSDFSLMDGSSLNLSKVKGWLFKNLPDKHAHSSVLGGEISVVDSIMACLMSPPHLQKVKKPNLTPNILLDRVRPLLGLNTRSLVLALWKFIHISGVQERHNVEDSVVDEIIPMPLAAVEGLREEANIEEAVPSIAELINSIIKQEDFTFSEEALLPQGHVTHQLSTLERRILHDYVVEVTSRQAFMKLDADLYRDDMATIRAQMKAQGKIEAAAKKDEKEVDTRGKTYLQLLKEKRDYKRRRQKYRARNVHITRKTPTEIFKTIISNRIEEIKAMLTDKDTDTHSVAAEVCERKGLPESEGMSRRRVRSKSRGRDLERDRHHKKRWSRDGDDEGHRHRKKRRRSRSRDRGRSRGREKSTSRERGRSRGRERSTSRERGRSRGRERSKSRERRNKRHKKHRYRSSSNS